MAKEAATVETPAAPSVPPSAPATARTGDRPPLSTADIQRALGGDPPSAAPVATPEPAAPAAPQAHAAAAPPPEAAAPTADPLAEVSAFIDGYKDDETPVAAAPATQPAAPADQPSAVADPVVAQVQEWAKDPAVARQAVQYANAALQMNNALNSNQPAEALKMFAPAAFEQIKNHLFETYKEEFTQRLLNDDPARPTTPASTPSPVPPVAPSPEVALLRQQVEAMSQKLTARERAEVEQQTQVSRARQAQEQAQRFTSYMDQLWTRTGITDADDKLFIQGAIMTKLSNDPAQRQLVQSGKLAPIGAAFRDVYKSYMGKRGPIAPADTGQPPRPTPTGGSRPASESPSEPSTPPSRGFEPNFDEEDGRRNFISAGLKRVSGWLQ